MRDTALGFFRGDVVGCCGYELARSPLASQHLWTLFPRTPAGVGSSPVERPTGWPPGPEVPSEPVPDERTGGSLGSGWERPYSLAVGWRPETVRWEQAE